MVDCEGMRGVSCQERARIGVFHGIHVTEWGAMLPDRQEGKAITMEKPVVGQFEHSSQS